MFLNIWVWSLSSEVVLHGFLYLMNYCLLIPGELYCQVSLPGTPMRLLRDGCTSFCANFTESEKSFQKVRAVIKALLAVFACQSEILTEGCSQIRLLLRTDLWTHVYAWRLFPKAKAGEVAPLLRALAALPELQSSASCTYVAAQFHC